MQPNERDSSGSLSAARPIVDSGNPDEDELDRYRREVEQCLGAELERLDDADIEAFFSHVIASFDRQEAASRCAHRWLVRRPR